VDVNTASEMLLQYVSGIGPAAAKNIVKFRQEKGLFKRRDELNKVINSKMFEQAAGFLRVRNGEVALDATGVHPERYSAVKDMATELSTSVSDLMGPGADKILPLKDKWVGLVGEFTFQDIYQELKKPGRDPRSEFQVFQFRDDIFELTDVKEGMLCNGIVTNVTNFGAFVDIGVHQDGLVHISELAETFVNDPQKVVSPGDQVKVKVKAVDTEKKQISLTMKLSDTPVARSTPKTERTGAGAPRSGNNDRPRGPRPDGDRPRGPRPEGQQRSAGGRDNRDQRGPGGRGGGKPQGGGQGPRPGGKPAGKPFNNPFAALGDFSKK